MVGAKEHIDVGVAFFNLFTDYFLLNVYSVVKVQPDFSVRNNSVVTSPILEKKMTFAVGLAGPLSSPRRAISQALRRIH